MLSVVLEGHSSLHVLHRLSIEMTTIDGVRMVVPAPEGYVVDLNNPERTGVPSVYYVAGFMGSLSLIFFAQRMYVKAVVATGIELDDGRFDKSKLFSLVLHLNSPTFPLTTPQRRQMKQQCPPLHRNLMIQSYVF